MKEDEINELHEGPFMSHRIGLPMTASENSLQS